ncbi:MAG: DUF393 domain-containing protein [Verrucomicrobia bacterium]|nr:DUF393 domain-containing protein [Verrucomicrobiota bacterium]MBI3871385.1 DUF393 domain-containing protein [Verrucomicrobiota bacterium]
MNEPQRSTHLVIYDDRCSFCVFQMRALTWLDWFNRVSLVPASHPDVPQYTPGILPAAFQEAIHCVTPDGRVYRGARAIRFLCARMPLAWILALILWIPGVIWIAERVYRWVSRNRYVLSRFFGCGGACAVMPVRERENEKTLGVSPPAPRV